jgi:uncharacterized membrane protein
MAFWAEFVGLLNSPESELYKLISCVVYQLCITFEQTTAICSVSAVIWFPIGFINTQNYMGPFQDLAASILSSLSLALWVWQSSKRAQ